MIRFKSKIVSLISLIFLNYAIYLIAITPPASGYEVSIYNAYPIYFPLFMIFSFLCSIWIILHAIYIEKIDLSCLISVIVLFIINGILILLPRIRGYAFYQRSDALTHIGMIRDILNSGHIANNNFYPMFHVESAAIMQILKIDILALTELIALICLVSYIFSIYILTSLITKNRKSSLFSLLFASIPLIGDNLTGFTPSSNLCFLVPFCIFVFYLDLRKQSLQNRILFIILLILVPFMHPEIVVFLLILFLFFSLFNHPNSFLKLPYSLGEKYYKNPINLILILFASFIIWYYSFIVFTRWTQRLYSSLIEQTVSQPLNSYTTLISRSQLSTIEIIELVVRKNGAHLIYIIFAFLIVFIIIKEIMYRRNVKLDIIYIASVFLICCFMNVLSLFTDVLLDYGRILKYTLMLSTLVIGIFLTSNIKKIKNNEEKKLLSIIFILLAISTLISVYNFYPSPFVKYYNPQVTTMEMKGANWLINFGNKETSPIEMFLAFGRFTNAIEGYNYSLKYNSIYANTLYNPDKIPPDHFNYINDSNLGEFYPDDKYLLINKLMEVFYSNLWPNIGRFNSEDFLKLNNDKTIDKIYENGEFYAYYVHGKRVNGLLSLKSIVTQQKHIP